MPIRALALACSSFQNFNVLPRRVVAEHASPDQFHIQVEISGLAEHMVSMITAKIGETPCVHSAYWHQT